MQAFITVRSGAQNWFLFSSKKHCTADGESPVFTEEKKPMVTY